MIWLINLYSAEDQFCVCKQRWWVFFVGGAYLVAENYSFQVAVYGSNGIIFFFFLKGYIWVYISKFRLYSCNSEIISHNSNKKNQLVFSPRLMSLYATLLAFFPQNWQTYIVVLNRVIKSELGYINVHLQEKSQNCESKQVNVVKML